MRSRFRTVKPRRRRPGKSVLVPSAELRRRLMRLRAGLLDDLRRALVALADVERDNLTLRLSEGRA